MRTLFSYLLFWVSIIAFLFILGMFMIPDHDKAISDKHADGLQKNPELIQLSEKYSKARVEFASKNYLKCLYWLQEGEADLVRLRNIPDQFKYNYYILQGAAHWSLWQYVDAEKSWLSASRYSDDKQQKSKVRELLQQSHQVLERVNDERNTRNVYLASPFIGPAGNLHGHIVLVYIYVEDRDSHDWSLRSRTHAMNTWMSAQSWITDQARHYGGNLQFTRRFFVVDKNPGIKRLKVGDVTNGFTHANKLVQLVAEQLGYKNILDFTNQMKTEEGADEVIILFHLDKNGRSFASRCMQSCTGHGEYVFLLESTRVKHWQSLEYAQAHESMHLFGADDLYNIRDAREYAARDIMNYPAKILQGSTLEDITAYAVGLKRIPPKTPFKIETYTDKNQR